MRVIREQELRREGWVAPCACLAVGMFDGLHKGHQFLLRKLKQQASATNSLAGIISFSPHPAEILRGKTTDFLLTTERERIERMEDYLDFVCFLNYTDYVQNMPPEVFLEQKVHPFFSITGFIMGHDSHFGKNRSGNIDLLRNWANDKSFPVHQVDAYVTNALPKLSSTQIRNALKHHDVHLATDMLGYNYTLRGFVVHGDKRGRTLGFPTANISLLDKAKLMPENGVYGVKIQLPKTKRHNDCTFLGMMNIGVRPTFAGTKRVIEAHIFDFDDDIYDEEIEVQLCTFIRPEIKFRRIDDLIAQLQNDKKQTHITLQKYATSINC